LPWSRGGTNNLIKTGATPVTCAEDVLFALGMDPAAGRAAGRRGDTAEEQAVLDLLYGGITDGHELLLQTSLPAVQFNQALTMLEISGKVRALGNNHWTAA
jgi:predicted Rossmann fold nucleotide-binding protein DprA/Smf involved in DNA uptake